ncbi:MAG: TetR/AcrR family transcriptional regulator [Thermodesulfobacteriota bacterium]|nr:TetR/AcrR family transcriptional regulator [Thermodesulfobacteriota bacterium]
MVKTKALGRPANPSPARSFPPGRTKIVEALRKLLEKKEFQAITTAEIAKNAGVTEALIYKYFKDKRDLLYQILGEYLEHYKVRHELDLKGIKGAINKLGKSVWTHINIYATDRVFARILLLEVRSFSDYYTSEPYRQVKDYSNITLRILEEGIETGEFRRDISPVLARQAILGSIENVCMTEVAFDREILTDELADELCEFILCGIRQNPAKE